MRAARLRPAQVLGSYIASASQVSVSALERRYGRSRLACASSGRAIAALGAAATPPLLVHPRYGHPLRFYITPHFRKCRAVVPLKLHLVPHTAARPNGFPKQALCKVAYAGVGRTAVGAPRSRVHALRAAVCTPLWCACTWALVRRCALCAWSVACGQSCGVCPRPPVGLAAARLGSALNCPSAPQGGSLSQRSIGSVGISLCYYICSFLRN